MGGLSFLGRSLEVLERDEKSRFVKKTVRSQYGTSRQNPPRARIYQTMSHLSRVAAMQKSEKGSIAFRPAPMVSFSKILSKAKIPVS